MILNKLVFYVRKYNTSHKARSDKISLVRRIADRRFKTVNLADDVFNLYTNTEKVLRELKDRDPLLDLRKASKILNEVLSYPEVTQYVANKFDAIAGDNDELDEPEIAICEDEDEDETETEDDEEEDPDYVGDDKASTDDEYTDSESDDETSVGDIRDDMHLHTLRILNAVNLSHNGLAVLGFANVLISVCTLAVVLYSR